MKNVVIIDPVSAGSEYINASIELGLKPIVVGTEANSFELSSEDRLRCELHTFNNASCINLANIVNTGETIAVVAGNDYAVPTAARLASCITPKRNFGPSVSSAEIVRCKKRFRNALRKANILQPEYKVIDASDSVVDTLKEFEYPAVIKPINLAGSMGVRAVANSEDAHQWLKHLADNPLLDMAEKQAAEFLMEQYIHGPEYSVEGIVSLEGDIRFVSITTKLVTEPPYFVEIGHLVGIKLDPELESDILSYCASIISSIGLTASPFHLEIKLSNENRPVAIELGARLPGDGITELIRRSTGFCLASSYLKAMQGMALDELFVSKIAACSYSRANNSEIRDWRDRGEREFFETPSQTVAQNWASEAKQAYESSTCIY